MSKSNFICGAVKIPTSASPDLCPAPIGLGFPTELIIDPKAKKIFVHGKEFAKDCKIVTITAKDQDLVKMVCKLVSENKYLNGQEIDFILNAEKQKELKEL